VRQRAFNNEPRDNSNSNNNSVVPARAMGWLRTRFGRFQLGPHQINASRLFARPGIPGLLLYYRVGSGKTLASIAAAENLATREGVRRGVVVICPASLRKNYEKELTATGVDARRYSILSFQQVMNMNHARRQALGRGKVLIIDEVQNLRTWQAKKTDARMLRAALDVSEVAHKRLLLSGTPIMNFPYEIGPLVALLHGYNEPKIEGEHDEREIAMLANLREDPIRERNYLQSLSEDERAALNARIMARLGGLPLIRDNPLNMTLRAFKEKYGKTFTKNQDELAELLRCKVLYYSDPDRSKYPTKTETWVEVPMTNNQVKAQFRLAQDDPGTANIEELLDGRVSIVFMTRPRTVNLRLRDEHPKLDIVVERITEAYRRGQKSIAFSTYLGSGLHRISDMLTARGVPHELYVGGLNDTRKKDILQRYNAGTVPVLLLSEAGKEGLDLKNTAFVHVLEPAWNEEKIEQVIGRAVRYESHTGPDRHVQVYRYISVFPTPMPPALRALQAPPGVPESILRQYSADRILQLVTERKNDNNKRFLEWLIRLADRNLAECLDPANGALRN
jgi:SNF2 family DNA or RNA helicase